MPSMIFVAFGIPQIDAVAFDDDAHAFLVERGGVGEGMYVMGGVERAANAT
jgi:hypothetical protein